LEASIAPSAAPALLCLFLELGTNGLGVGACSLEHPTHHPVLQRRVKEVLARQVEASPLDRLLGRALQELRRGVAKELGNVHLLGLSLRNCPAPANPQWLFLKEPVEEVVEEAAASTQRGSSSEGRAPDSGLRSVDLAEVLDPLAFPGDYPSYRDDRRPDAANIAHPSRSHFASSLWSIYGVYSLLYTRDPARSYWQPPLFRIPARFPRLPLAVEASLLTVFLLTLDLDSSTWELVITDQNRGCGRCLPRRAARSRRNLHAD
jgi:hypothetical protein